MASNNRAGLINKVIKVVKKYYKPTESPKDRKVLEHLVFASCAENSSHEDAEKVFGALNSDYFDWNEVRVSSIRELAGVMKSLNDPEVAAMRVKRVLQSVFETQYSFDLEPMKKQNIGQAIKQLERFHGTTPFTVAYVTQHGLGGHSIPINQGLLEAMRVVGVVSDTEAAKGGVPGLERAVPKTKGAEIGSLLHQLGVELHRSPLGPTTRKILLEIDPNCKDRLPKRQTKQPDKVVEETPVTVSAPAPAAGKKGEAKKAALDGKKEEPKKAEAKKAASPAPVKKKTDAKAAPPKKAVKKVAAAKSVASPAKKSPTKKLAKKKPK
jgi:endonuclease-3